MSRDQLVAMARRSIDHAKANTIELVDEVFRVPARNYFDPARWEQEMERIFYRMPLVMGFSCEMAKPGDYKALEVAGTPVLMSRGADGVVRAFVNSCSHRGAIVVKEGTGHARRFSCPYHAWTYDQQGDLVGILDRDSFGSVDTSCLGLTALPVAERAGLILVWLRPNAALDIDTFLCGYDDLLGHLGFVDCRVVGSQTIAGPNWKVAYDGYLDLYHLPVLHRETFGANMANKALYTAWGPHQRVTSPSRNVADLLADVAPEQWPTERLTLGVWTIFPHVSIASFESGGRVFMVSQLYPGVDPGSSFTVQTFLHTQPDAPGQAEEIEKTMAFLHHVVQDEDYYTGLRIQRALKTGLKSEVLFGRNEGGGQRFHRWIDAILAAADDDLAALFKAGID